MRTKIILYIQEFLFSRYCYLCLSSRAHIFPLCRPCLKSFCSIKNHCPQCGITLQSPHLCGQCLQKRNPIHQTIPTFVYQTQVKEAILHLKFHKGLYLSQPLAALMHHKLRHHYKLKASLPDGLISVPLHRKKMFKRGYNQSLALSKHLSQLMKLPELSAAVAKQKATLDQSSLQLKERKKNIKDAFIVLHKLPKHIAIIDDVMTTGETVKQLAIILKKHGVKKVDVWCLARTPIFKN